MPVLPEIALGAAGAPLLVSASPGCSLQIAAALAGRGERVAVAHAVEMLDASLRGLLPPESGQRP